MLPYSLKDIRYIIGDLCLKVFRLKFHLPPYTPTINATRKSNNNVGFDFQHTTRSFYIYSFQTQKQN